MYFYAKVNYKSTVGSHSRAHLRPGALFATLVFVLSLCDILFFNSLSLDDIFSLHFPASQLSFAPRSGAKMRTRQNFANLVRTTNFCRSTDQKHLQML